MKSIPFFWSRPFLLMLAVAVPNFCFAGGAMVQGRVKELNIPVNGNYVRFSLDTATINPGNCEKAEFYVVEIPTSNNAVKTYIAALMLAKATQAPVAVWVDGCTKSKYWWATRPNPYDIYLY